MVRLAPIDFARMLPGFRVGAAVLNPGQLQRVQLGGVKVVRDALVEAYSPLLRGGCIER